MIPVLTADEMRDLERWAIQSGKVTSLDLQEAAAQGAVLLVPEGVPVEVIAGPGNNGGDALAVARLLKQRGQHVRVWTLAPDPKWSGDAAVQAERWKAMEGEMGFTERPYLDGLVGHAPGIFFVDGMFGIGANRSLDGVAKTWAQDLAVYWLKEGLALDLPSGLHPDDPDGKGEHAFASRTACFGFRKLCHVLKPAAEFCGEVHVIPLPLDLYGSPIRPRHWVIDEPVLPQPSWDSHKGSKGHVGIRAGKEGMSGAAVLAALGALRVGAGLVTVLVPQAIRAEVAAQIPEALVQVWNGIVPSGIEVLLVGPGGVDQIPEWEGPLVLDASALKEGDGPKWMARRDTIITPHPGEFARLFQLPKPDGTQARLDQATTVATGPGVLLLKGAQSLILGGENQNVWINTTGHWGLATGGTGDFLAGMVAGLVAQKSLMTGWPAEGQEMKGCAATAAWLHGKCADRLGLGPLLPRDLAEALPKLLRDLYAGRPA